MAHVGLGGGSQMTGNSWTVLFSTHTAIVQLHGHHDSPGCIWKKREREREKPYEAVRVSQMGNIYTGIFFAEF